MEQHQQSGKQMPQRGQGMGLALSDVETPEQQQAVNSITRAVQVCEWCADQCVKLADPGMIECISLCEDVSELGHPSLALIPRNSRFTLQHLQTLQQAMQTCAQECGSHQHAHCQECAQVLDQASNDIQQYLGTLQQGTQGQQMYR